MSPEREDSALCGILLHPAGHTLSPVLHEAAYRALGLTAHYEVWDVRPAELEGALADLRGRGLAQASVSLPHKQAVLKLAERASGAALRIGAANTLTRRGSVLEAENTDWIGVCGALEPLGPWAGREALVVGAGGTARAVVHALHALGMNVAVVNRTPERAERLCHDLGARPGDLDAAWDLLVNATSVGMEPDADATPVPAERLRPGATVFDAVYRPLETRLLREARERGCRTQDGLDMLVYQAVEQIRLWSGRVIAAAPLRRAAEQALRAP